MLYSDKRVLKVFICEHLFVLPTGCDARSLPGPRASLIGQANPQPTWNQLRGPIIDIAMASTALLLIVIVGVPAAVMILPASVFRAGQTKGKDFVVSGSLDFLVTRAPIEDAVYD